MSAALAEDLRDPAPAPALDTPANSAPSGRCPAPAIPASTGAWHAAASCLQRPAPRPRLVQRDPPRAAPPPRCPDVHATGQDGALYPANLLHDILMYRSLRARQMEGRPLHPEDDDLFLELEARLRPEAVSVRADGRATRQFLRWDTNVIPGVGLSDSLDRGAVALPVDTVDLGAGGLCVVTELTLHAGDQISVRVHGSEGDAHRLVVLPARVAWARGRRVGLMFAGGPSWD